jgi:hypothetical protein
MTNLLLRLRAHSASFCRITITPCFGAGFTKSPARVAPSEVCCGLAEVHTYTHAVASLIGADR